jgi:hypothetical protein
MIKNNYEENIIKIMGYGATAHNEAVGKVFFGLEVHYI